MHLDRNARCFAGRRISHISAVHRGTAFEERALRLLQAHLSMSLRRTGGKSDGGVDLQGWWWLPHTAENTSSTTGHDCSERRRVRVLAQCKAEKKKFSPNYVREMEGVLHRYLSSMDQASNVDEDDRIFQPTGWHSPVGLLLSESSFTTATMLRVMSSSVPFLLLHLPPMDSDDAPGRDASEDQIGAVFWNFALSGERGLLDKEYEIRWERSASGKGRPGLWWKNHKIKSWTPDGDVPIS